MRDPEPSEAFSLSVSTSLDYGPNSCKKRKIRVCASYLLNDEESNMAVIEVTLVSGYIPIKDDLKRIVGYGTGIIKRYEVDGNKVLFYIDQFTARETCVEFAIVEEVEVENAKPGTVKVYDYYEPEFFITEVSIVTFSCLGMQFVVSLSTVLATRSRKLFILMCRGTIYLRLNV